MKMRPFSWFLSPVAMWSPRGALKLQNHTGQLITDKVYHDVLQYGQQVAEATYDYRLTSGENDDGLYIGYGLTQVELLENGANALILNAAGKTGSGAELSALLTGTGDLAISSAQGETVTLSNHNNDYTGITDIRSGDLQMDDHNVLGKTSEVRLNALSGLDMNGHSQTIGKLTAAADSRLNLNGGALTLTHGGTAEGQLSGGGKLNVNGGILEISGANSNLTANTTIADQATVQLNNILGLGTGGINNGGTLAMNHISGILDNALSGGGVVTLTGSNAVLTGNNRHFSGQFNVDNSSAMTVSEGDNLGKGSVYNQGTLVLNSDTDWQLDNAITGNGTVRKTGAGVLTVDHQAAWNGETHIEQGTLKLGSEDSPVMLSSSQVNIAAQGTLTGFGGVAGNLKNSGTIVTSKVQPISGGGVAGRGATHQYSGNQLVVMGNYIGDNGHLVMNATLDGNNTVTDKLIVHGNTSGKTFVSVNHMGALVNRRSMGSSWCMLMVCRTESLSRMVVLLLARMTILSSVVWEQTIITGI